MSDVILHKRGGCANMSVSIPREWAAIIEKFCAEKGCSRSNAVVAFLEPGIVLKKEGGRLPAEERISF